MDNTSSQEVIVLAPGGGPTLTFMDAKIAYKVSSSDTGGAWALLEYALPRHFAGMPLHWHKVTQHGFYVLEGKLSFQLGSQIFTAEPGAFISVPTQTLHRFSNPQDGSARLLEIIIPSGYENFLKEVVALSQIEPDLLLQPRKLLELYKRYDTFLPVER